MTLIVITMGLSQLRVVIPLKKVAMPIQPEPLKVGTPAHGLAYKGPCLDPIYCGHEGLCENCRVQS